MKINTPLRVPKTSPLIDETVINLVFACNRIQSSMCKVYNSLGSLMAIKAHLRAQNVNEFKSVKELVNFRKNYSSIRQEVISRHSLLIEQEKNTLSEELTQLNEVIQTRRAEVEKKFQLELDELRQPLALLNSTRFTVLQGVIKYLKKIRLKRKVRKCELNFTFKVANSLQALAETLSQKSDRYQYLLSHFEEATKNSGLVELSELARKNRIIDQVNTSIYGAFGEQKVVKELESLSDDYILINNFNCLFDPPVYNRQEEDYIASVQIDHLLLSRAGIFLIETKNWSQQSLNNLSFRSPVQQVKRANFGLFKILEDGISGSNLNLDHHHWGTKKVPIRNLIVLINEKPDQEFEYVKVLTLKELVSYVKYFKHSFSVEETERMAHYLLSRNGQITDTSGFRAR